MKFLLISFLLVVGVSFCKAQGTLPNITVQEQSGNIVVSWKNAYNVPVTSINIQRSYDSLRNFTTIGSVLNPQNVENGYFDKSPPYKKMYYRVFIGFEGGSYLFSRSYKPNADTASVATAIMPWQVNPFLDSSFTNTTGSPTRPASLLLYNRNDAVVLNLPNAPVKNYVIKFYDYKQQNVLTLRNIKETLLIIEKVNFRKAGTYSFEIFEDDVLIDTNVVIVPRDAKNK